MTRKLRPPASHLMARGKLQAAAWLCSSHHPRLLAIPIWWLSTPWPPGLPLLPEPMEPMQAFIPSPELALLWFIPHAA